MQKILVVDDDQDLRESMVEILQDAGLAVTGCERADKALVLLESDSFALVLLDLVMPGMGGMEALSRIRALAPATKVIMVTAFSTTENAVAAMRQGASDYLVKPFRNEELLAASKRVLEEARFEACGAALDAESALNCLANTLRRQILFGLKTCGPLRFMEICRHLNIADHTKVNFHLKILREAGFIEQDEKLYQLTARGRQILECVQFLMRRLGS
ncbi:Helix-turn-helix domain-containing protein [Geoalkalibacter ferrihydriticus]|uniref:Helix-turn-helix domain-containing protein n=1 Tax=Geoalkalibacter ferrihydriticus TaxID=392333 RepID=A0A1G9NA79_9BACT|nr:response regulator [Geoalkalibacter ferrihydriticus]SDL83017.1 Helix-turn-helix domain-containing protein [Geoalkalibacter ferrihydriticus]